MKIHPEARKAVAEIMEATRREGGKPFEEIVSLWMERFARREFRRRRRNLTA